MQAIILDVISTSRGLPCKLYYSMMSFLHSGGSRQAIILDVISASRGLPCKLLHSMLSFLQAGWTCVTHQELSQCNCPWCMSTLIKTVCRNHSIQVAMCIYIGQSYIYSSVWCNLWMFSLIRSTNSWLCCRAFYTGQWNGALWYCEIWGARLSCVCTWLPWELHQTFLQPDAWRGDDAM